MLSWPRSCVWAGVCSYLLALRPLGVRRERPHGCLRSAEAPGVVLIKEQSWESLLGLSVELLLVVPDGSRRYTEPCWSDWLRYESVCHQNEAIRFQISHATVVVVYVVVK